jgi:hypothetical protein
MARDRARTARAALASGSPRRPRRYATAPTMDARHVSAGEAERMCALAERFLSAIDDLVD